MTSTIRLLHPPARDRQRQSETIEHEQEIKDMPRGGKRPGAGRPKGSRDKRQRSSPVLIARAEQKRELREAARELTPDALDTLAKICRDGQSESARVSAANAILDRGYGKPMQQIESGGPGDFAHMSDEELEAIIEESTQKIAALRANGVGKH